MSAIAPLTFLMLAVGSIGFQALVFGSDLVEASIIATVNNPSCADDLGALETIACYIRVFVLGIVNAGIVIASVVAFFFNALTFNIPGAPGIVRVIVGTFFIGGLGWAIASLFRGTTA